MTPPKICRALHPNVGVTMKPDPWDDEQTWIAVHSRFCRLSACNPFAHSGQRRGEESSTRRAAAGPPGGGHSFQATGGRLMAVARPAVVLPSSPCPCTLPEAQSQVTAPVPDPALSVGPSTADSSRGKRHSIGLREIFMGRSWRRCLYPSPHATLALLIPRSTRDVRRP